MKVSSQPLLLIIAGPTSSGKTEMGIRLAQWLETEILSADSRQFYRELKIGTAAPDVQQLNKVPHHFIGHRGIDQPYDISLYESDALQLLKRLFLTKKAVVMVGGSGLYINAVCRGIDELPGVDPGLRITLQQRLKKEGMDSLLKELKSLDPKYYEQMDKNNPGRLIRALEVCLQTGAPFSSLRTGKATSRSFRTLKFCLNLPREVLHERIALRTDKMFETGLVEEARKLLPFRHLNALNTVGYKELFMHFDGEYNLQQAKEKIKTNTRRYARRQLTWFRKDTEFKWVNPDDYPLMKLVIQSAIK